MRASRRTEPAQGRIILPTPRPLHHHLPDFRRGILTTVAAQASPACRDHAKVLVPARLPRLGPRGAAEAVISAPRAYLGGGGRSWAATRKIKYARNVLDPVE